MNLYAGIIILLIALSVIFCANYRIAALERRVRLQHLIIGAYITKYGEMDVPDILRLVTEGNDEQE